MSKNSNLAEVAQLGSSNSTSVFLPTNFEDAQRMAKALAASSLVPKEYVNNVANCLISMDMAMRLQANVLMVMQNLYIVHGRPGWSSQFLIASFNKQRGFSPLRYEFKGTPKQNDWACRAFAMDLGANEKLEGTWITWEMAKAEGWIDKNGSKWKTMPEQMMRYRAASFFIRTYAPDVSMGLYTQEELYDMPPIEGEVVGKEEEAKAVDDIIEGKDEPTDLPEQTTGTVDDSPFTLEKFLNQVEQCTNSTQLFQTEMLIDELPEVDQSAAKDALQKKSETFTESEDVPQ